MRIHLSAADHGVMDPGPALYTIRINGLGLDLLEVRQLELDRESPEPGDGCSP